MSRLIFCLMLLGCSNHLTGIKPLHPSSESDTEHDLDVEVLPYTSNQTEDCEAVRIEGKDTPQPVDILWAIDTSPSMNNETKTVRSQLNRFAHHVTSAGMDIQVVLIGNDADNSGICIEPPLGSGRCPEDHNPPQLFRQYQWIGSHNALGRFISEFDDYATNLREGSRKVYAVVTDDHSDWNAAQFIESRDLQDPGSVDDWTFYGFYCERRDKGDVYTQLVEETEGQHIELCASTPDWDGVFDEMAETVIQNNVVSCAIPIPDAPPNFEFQPGKLNVDIVDDSASKATRIPHVANSLTCGAQHGWYYNNPITPDSIQLCPASCNVAQSHPDNAVDVWFGCTTEHH